MVATSIISDEPPADLLPEKVRETIIKTRVEVDKQMEDVPEKLEKLGLTFDDLIHMVEVADADQVKAAITELLSTEIKSEDQVFDIGIKHVKIEGYNLEIFREVFKEKASLKRINKALYRISENDLMTSISVPVARETAKQILIDKRDKVEKLIPK